MCGRIGFVGGRRERSGRGRSGEPVVTVERDADEKFVGWNKLQRVLQIADGPVPTGDRPGVVQRVCWS